MSQSAVVGLLRGKEERGEVEDRGGKNEEVREKGMGGVGKTVIGK